MKVHNYSVTENSSTPKSMDQDLKYIKPTAFNYDVLNNIYDDDKDDEIDMETYVGVVVFCKMGFI